MKQSTLFILFAALCLVIPVLSQTTGGSTLTTGSWRSIYGTRRVGAEADVAANITLSATLNITVNGTGAPVNTTAAWVFFNQTLDYLNRTAYPNPSTIPPESVSVSPNPALEATTLSYEILYKNNNTENSSISNFFEISKTADPIAQLGYFINASRPLFEVVLTQLSAGNINASIFIITGVAGIIPGTNTTTTTTTTTTATTHNSSTTTSSAPSLSLSFPSFMRVGTVVCLLLAYFL